MLSSFKFFSPIPLNFLTDDKNHILSYIESKLSPSSMELIGWATLTFCSELNWWEKHLLVDNSLILLGMKVLWYGGFVWAW